MPSGDLYLLEMLAKHGPYGTHEAAVADAISQLQVLQGLWSDATFGERTPIEPLSHLEEEIKEVMAEPGDIMEWADCLLLYLDSARLAGFTINQIIEAAKKKQEINRNRKWERTPEGYFKHVKES